MKSYSRDYHGCLLPLSVGLVACSEVVKQPAVHLHKCLENIVYKRHNRLVPMLLTYPAERGSVTFCYMIFLIITQTCKAPGT